VAEVPPPSSSCDPFRPRHEFLIARLSAAAARSSLVTFATPVSPDRNFSLNPSDFAFLWEECARCFYLKVVDNIRRPKVQMPRIFSTIDAAMKEFYGGKPTRDITPLLPAGVIGAGAERVRSFPLSVPGHSSTCTIRGRPDTILRFDEGSYGIVDFKTSETRTQHKQLYGRQLHAYAVALENAAPGHLALSPVARLGLVVFEPSAFSSGSDETARLTGSVKWTEIPRDDGGFWRFLGQVLDILERASPPDAPPSCKWCTYRDAARSTGL